MWVHVVAEFVNGNTAADVLYLDGVRQTLTQVAGSPASRSVATTGQISGWSARSTRVSVRGATGGRGVLCQGAERGPGAGPLRHRCGLPTATPTATSAPTATVMATATTTSCVAGGASGYNAAVLADGPAAFWRLNSRTYVGAGFADGSGQAGNMTGSVTLGTAGPLSDGAEGRRGWTSRRAGRWRCGCRGSPRQQARPQVWSSG